LYCLEDKVVGLICSELTKPDVLAMEASLKSNGYKLTQNMQYMGGFPANYANLWTSADGTRQCRVGYKGFLDFENDKPIIDMDKLDFVASLFATDIIALAVKENNAAKNMLRPSLIAVLCCWAFLSAAQSTEKWWHGSTKKPT
jgi:hypothetical protein